jgi:uncharacterized protein
MRYLLDVSALLAFGVIQHEFHSRASDWISSLESSDNPELLTCSITELGFVRVVAQVSQYSMTLTEAQALLLRVKREGPVRFSFLADDQDINNLPDWVRTAAQITDGHLARLASAHNAVLATLDTKIPRAFLIPAAK